MCTVGANAGPKRYKKTHTHKKQLSFLKSQEQNKTGCWEQKQGTGQAPLTLNTTKGWANHLSYPSHPTPRHPPTLTPGLTPTSGSQQGDLLFVIPLSYTWFSIPSKPGLNFFSGLSSISAHGEGQERWLVSALHPTYPQRGLVAQSHTAGVLVEVSSPSGWAKPAPGSPRKSLQSPGMGPEGPRRPCSQSSRPCPHPRGAMWPKEPSSYTCRWPQMWGALTSG